MCCSRVCVPGACVCHAPSADSGHHRQLDASRPSANEVAVCGDCHRASSLLARRALRVARDRHVPSSTRCGALALRHENAHRHPQQRSVEVRHALASRAPVALSWAHAVLESEHVHCVLTLFPVRGAKMAMEHSNYSPPRPLVEHILENISPDNSPRRGDSQRQGHCQCGDHQSPHGKRGALPLGMPPWAGCAGALLAVPSLAERSRVHVRSRDRAWPGAG